MSHYYAALEALTPNRCQLPKAAWSSVLPTACANLPLITNNNTDYHQQNVFGPVTLTPPPNAGLAEPPRAPSSRSPPPAPTNSFDMASANLAPTPQSVIQLVHKLSEPDPDYRFMALNDLIAIFEKGKPDFLHHDYNAAARTVDSIIKVLDDQNGEVQNLAIKW